MLALLFAFVALALSQAAPKLSDSFSSTVTAMFHVRGHRFHFEGDWFNDFAGNHERFEGLHDNVERGDLYRNWNNTAGGLEYFYRAADKQCMKRDFTFHHWGVWDFLAQAKHTGSCNDRHTAGNRWVFNNAGVSLDGCISTDGKTPYWHNVRLHAEDRDFFVIFHKWNPATPAPSVFTLPASCK